MEMDCKRRAALHNIDARAHWWVSTQLVAAAWAQSARHNGAANYRDATVDVLVACHGTDDRSREAIYNGLHWWNYLVIRHERIAAWPRPSPRIRPGAASSLIHHDTALLSSYHQYSRARCRSHRFLHNVPPHRITASADFRFDIFEFFEGLHIYCARAFHSAERCLVWWWLHGYGYLLRYIELIVARWGRGHYWLASKMAARALCLPPSRFIITPFHCTRREYASFRCLNLIAWYYASRRYCLIVDSFDEVDFIKIFIRHQRLRSFTLLPQFII